MFVQTEIVNSPFRDTLPEHAFENDYASCLRYIDWQRGNPYTFTDGDLDELLAAPETALFARKFDYRTSPGVVDALFDRFG